MRKSIGYSPARRLLALALCAVGLLAARGVLPMQVDVGIAPAAAMHDVIEGGQGIPMHPGAPDPGLPVLEEPQRVNRNIVFLIDASGSMLRTMPFVRDELNRVIQGLHPTQQFQVIYFTGSGIGEMPGGDPDTRWIDATEENKEAAAQWLQSRKTGFYAHGPASRHLLEALEWTLFQEPALVFFISDSPTGQGQHEVEQEMVLETIAACNHRDRPATINTIQFLSTDPLTEFGMRATLERIAEETGGNYKFLTDRELNLR